MPKKILLYLVLLIIITSVVFVLFYFQNQKVDYPIKINLSLEQYNDSGQTGTATLTEVNNQLEVKLNLLGYDTNLPQPVHIHSGTCDRLGPVVYPLEDITNNSSTTILNTTLSELLSKAKQLSVNVHESYDNPDTYTSCVSL